MTITSNRLHMIVRSSARARRHSWGCLPQDCCTQCLLSRLRHLSFPSNRRSGRSDCPNFELSLLTSSFSSFSFSILSLVSLVLSLCLQLNPRASLLGSGNQSVTCRRELLTHFSGGDYRLVPHAGKTSLNASLRGDRAENPKPMPPGG